MFEKDEEVASCNPGSTKASAASRGQLEQGVNISRAGLLALSLFPHFLCPFLFACVGLILSCCRPAPSRCGRGNLGAASFGPHFSQLPPLRRADLLP